VPAWLSQQPHEHTPGKRHPEASNLDAPRSKYEQYGLRFSVGWQAKLGREVDDRLGTALYGPLSFISPDHAISNI
jgi:hypothetical protein